jgi:uncharacterized delta-60 repeat protein
LLWVVRAAVVVAAPGDLDPSFNGGSLLPVDLTKTTPGSTQLYDVRLDAAGRIVVAGASTDENGRFAVALARFAANGAPDASFGAGGSLVTQAGRGGGTVFSLVRTLEARPGGAGWIVTGGASATDGRQAVLALAVDDNGQLDLQFGTGGSTRIQPAGPAPEFTLAFGGDGGGAVGADGHVVVAHTIAVEPAGGDYRKLAVVKLGPQGQPDDGFASMGIYVNPFSASIAAARTNGSAARVVADGILVAGTTADGFGGLGMLLLRLTPAGMLDPTFAGGAGYRIVPASRGVALGLGPDGAIYVAGTAPDPDGHAAIAVVRFRPDGTLDGAFGPGGIVRLQTASADPGDSPASYALAVAADAEGRVLVTGTSGAVGYQEAVVVRLAADGAVDGTFGTGGVVRLQASTAAEPRTFGAGVALAPDEGTAVIVGFEYGSNRGFVTRLLLRDPAQPACPTEATTTAVLCELETLRAAVTAGVPSGRIRDRLQALLDKSAGRVEASAPLTGSRRRKLLKRAERPLGAFQRLLRTKGARRSLAADLIRTLSADAARIAERLATVRGAGA